MPPGIRIAKGKWSVHHIIPLEWAHLFPGYYPNDLRNLALIKHPLHLKLHGIFSNEMATSRRELINGGIPAERARDAVIRAFGAEFDRPSMQGVFYRLRVR